MATCEIRDPDTGESAEFKAPTEEQWYLFLQRGASNSYAAMRDLAAQCRAAPDPKSYLELLREWPTLVEFATDGIGRLGGLPSIRDLVEVLSDLSDHLILRIPLVSLTDETYRRPLLDCGISEAMLDDVSRRPQTTRSVLWHPALKRAYIVGPASTNAMVKRDQCLNGGRWKEAYETMVGSALLFPQFDAITERSQTEVCLLSALGGEVTRLQGSRVGSAIVKKG